MRTACLSRNPHVALFTDSRGWHERRLLRALRNRGARTTLLSLKDAGFDGDVPVLLGFSDALPDAVFVRNVPGGGFEQVTLCLGLLHALEVCGIPVHNSAHAIERTVDKSATGFLLHRAGIPTPPSRVCGSFEQARERLVSELDAGHQLVLKPLFGACGRGLRLLSRVDDLPSADAVAGVYYLQRFVGERPTAGRDWRVLVSRGRALAAMERRAAHWITNHARGGRCLPALLNPELARLAEAAAAAVGAAYAGVDLIRAPDGQLLVLEVNGVPAWHGLQSVCSIDIAQSLIDDLLACCPNTRLEAVS